MISLLKALSYPDVWLPRCSSRFRTEEIVQAMSYCGDRKGKSKKSKCQLA